MAVTIEAAFVLLDKASPKLKKIRDEALLTDKALKGMGGAGTSGGGAVLLDKWGKPLQSVADSAENATQKIKETGKAADQTSRTMRFLGRDFDTSKGLI